MTIHWHHQLLTVGVNKYNNKPKISGKPLNNNLHPEFQLHFWKQLEYSIMMLAVGLVYIQAGSEPQIFPSWYVDQNKKVMDLLWKQGWHRKQAGKMTPYSIVIMHSIVNLPGVEIPDWYFASVGWLLRNLEGKQAGWLWVQELKWWSSEQVIQEENDGDGHPKGNFHHACAAQMDYQLSQEAASARVADGAVLSASSQTVLHSSTQFSS